MSTDDTLASGAGLDATLAPATSGLDATLAPTSGATSASASTTIRAGGQSDYPELVPIDPKHYVVGGELARGGMGRILSARDRRLGRTVALKELLGNSPDLRVRFEREARITARLQHPSIVRILEAGAWPNGEPFYAMTLIAGESLDAAIARTTTLAERLALLPNAIAAVDALAYAHDARVIHRDLKPSNILVGKFGETVVIDWGLAKDLRDPDGPDVELGPYRTHDEPGATVAGAVVGTPLYMPAEQALGEAVDERADVYALGALLYHLLAGVAPYGGTTTNEILTHVIEGPPRPLLERVPEVPPDLAAIVTKAMAHAAADRYPTATQLATDLKSFQTGQLVGAHRYSTLQLVRRWIRRHRAPVAVAAIAIVVLAAVAIVSVRRIIDEQDRTETERRAATASRDQVEDLITFMLGDLRTKLQPLGKIDLLDVVARKAKAYYDTKGGTSDRDRRQRSLALNSLGAVLAATNDATGALAVYRESRAIRADLLAAAPDDSARKVDLALSTDNVGDELLELGKVDEALAEFRAGEALRTALVARDPNNLEWQRNLALDDDRIGDVLLNHGKGPEGLEHYRAAFAIREHSAQVAPSPDRQRELSFSYDKVAFGLSRSGDLVAGLAANQKALAIREALVASDATNTTWRLDLAVSHEQIGNVRINKKDPAGALVDFQAELAIMEGLTSADPRNDVWARRHANALRYVGRSLISTNQPKPGLDDLHASVAIVERLAAKNPGSVNLQHDLVALHTEISSAQIAQHEDPVGELQAAIAIGERLVEQDPKNAPWRGEVAYLHRVLGETRDDIAEVQRAIDYQQQIVTAEPTNQGRRDDLAVMFDKLGDIDLEKHDAAGAIVAYTASTAIGEAAAKKFPADAGRQHDFVEDNEEVARAQIAAGDRVAARATYEKGLVLARALAPADPERAKEIADIEHAIAACCP